MSFIGNPPQQTAFSQRFLDELIDGAESPQEYETILENAKTQAELMASQILGN